MYPHDDFLYLNAMQRDYDIIIVGSGAAGLAAAVAAADLGATVLVVESQKVVGGSSRLSGGHFYAAGTSLQHDAGIQDDADAMFEHYMTLNQWLVDPAIVRKFCDLSGPTFEWLKGHDVSFGPNALYPSGVSSTPRGHIPEGGGDAVVQALDGHRSHKGVELVLDARVTRLLTEDGRVCGVEVNHSDQATAGAVVLACGGFGANPEMIKTYYPDAAATGDWNWYIGAEGAQGDGIHLGKSVDAQIQGHNRGLLLVTPGFSRDLEVLLPNWLILVNEAGHRFTNEAAPYSVLGGLIQHQGGRAWAVFDETARSEAKPNPSSQAYWVDEILEQKAADGTIAKAESIEALAESLHIEPKGLIGTIERYNADTQTGDDTAFFKPGKRAAIETAPFYGVEVRPAILCWTGTGVTINAQTQVLDQAGRPITGLYAAGETVGNLHGDRYIGGGGSFGPCIVFGKLAGEEAQRYVAGLN